MAYFWLVVAIGLIVAEVATVAFFALFAAVGAIGAALAAAFGLDVAWQAAVFFVLSVAGLLVARPPLLRYFQRHPRPSGAREMIGAAAVVTDPIRPDHLGHVRIRGEQWPAISADGSPIREGAEVYVLEIRNTTLVVAP